MRIIIFFLLLVLSTTLLAGGVLAYIHPDPSGYLRVDLLDIGQGDSILLTSASGRRMLVDTGPDEAVLRKELAAVLPPLTRNIDVLLLTHSDTDHINGARMVLQEFDVRVLIVNDEEEISETMQEVLKTAESRGVSIVRASADQDLQIDAGLVIDILTPLKGFTAAADNANDHSIAFMALTPTSKLLFTGDAEAAEEEALVRTGVALKADWLKGGHHGSKTSTTEVFLRAVLPGTVLFQNGKNNTYKHPAKEVMDRLAEARIPVYNTSTSGRMHLRCPPDLPCTLTTEHRDNAP